MASGLQRVLGPFLVVFALVEVNRPFLAPQTDLAIFALVGSVLAFLTKPIHPSVADRPWARAIDLLFAGAAVVVYGYVAGSSYPRWVAWTGGVRTLGERAGDERALDVAIGAIGLVIVLEAARRTVGWALPLLSAAFLVYAVVGPHLPDWAFPHRGYGIERIVGQTFLHSQGVFGTALRVMFAYVFLFVVIGAVLKATGSTSFVVGFARRLFGGGAGGPAKVSVVSSGLMGSLSGSAVANTATTGTFTIPLMRSSGFKPAVAAGVEAAASSGGALVPPVMGAGAYMMLEIVDPPVTFVQILRAAVMPAVLYYLSLWLIVHFQARRVGVVSQGDEPRASGAEGEQDGASRYSGVVFAGAMATLLALLIAGYTVFRAASVALVVVIVTAAFKRETRLGLGRLARVSADAAKDAVPLVVASACVGIVIGVVTLTGVGTRLPSTILELSRGSLLPALILVMVSSIVLGMGLPSAVCYLLMATLVGPALGDLGVVPLSAHLFIFYFGMMSMVTPPVALAAYTAASIAGSNILETGWHAFRFALVGFALPFAFVYRPQLLMLAPDGGLAPAIDIVSAVAVAALGTIPFAAGMAGHLFGPLGRTAALGAAALLLLRIPIPGVPDDLPGAAVLGAALLVGLALVNRARAKVAAV